MVSKLRWAILVCLMLFQAACATTGRDTFRQEDVRAGGNVRICVSNTSSNTYRLYHRNAYLGSLYQGESRWVYIRESEFMAGERSIYAQNTSGQYDSRAEPAIVIEGVDYAWDLNESHVYNQNSITPALNGTKCEEGKTVHSQGALPAPNGL